MFRRNKRPDNGYYLSPFGEEFLEKRARRMNALAIAPIVPMIAAVILWIAPGIGSLLWLRGSYEAMTFYLIFFFVALIALVVCAVMSFFGYKPRKKIPRSSGPLLGFAKMSYNGLFVTAVVVTLAFVYQLVTVVGYAVSLGSGYIEKLAALYAPDAHIGMDAVSIIVTVLMALSAAGSWIYYVSLFRLDRPMQLVLPNDDARPSDAPAFPDPEEAEKHRPSRPDYSPPPPMFHLSEEEKEMGRREFEGSDDPHDDKNARDKKSDRGEKDDRDKKD